MTDDIKNHQAVTQLNLTLLHQEIACPIFPMCAQFIIDCEMETSYISKAFQKMST